MRELVGVRVRVGVRERVGMRERVGVRVRVRRGGTNVVAGCIAAGGRAHGRGSIPLVARISRYNRELD